MNKKELIRTLKTTRYLMMSYREQEDDESRRRATVVWNTLLTDDDILTGESLTREEIDNAFDLDDFEPSLADENKVVSMMKKANNLDELEKNLNIDPFEIMEWKADGASSDVVGFVSLYNVKFTEDDDIAHIVEVVAENNTLNEIDNGAVDYYLMHSRESVSYAIRECGFDSFDYDITKAVHRAIYNNVYELLQSEYMIGVEVMAFDYCSAHYGQISISEYRAIERHLWEEVEPCTTMGEVLRIVDLALLGDYTVEDFVKLYEDGEYIIIEMESSRLINSYNSLDEIPNIIRKMEVKAVSGLGTYEILV